MRPLRLTVEGFTSYRRRVEVDFSDLDLFAITGPTGAGKSSLVDAMAYALYGQAPRVRNQVRDLISQGAERMRVSLEFESGGRRYRISRSTARRGHADVQLEELDPQTGEWLPRADRRADVNQEVCRIVGMDYEGFVRSVVLPQGRFHLFLVGGRDERDRVLEDLLGLDLYRAVMQRANELAQRCQAQAEELSRRLQSELAYATPERLRELKLESLALRQERARLAHLAKRAQEALEKARRLAEERGRLRAASERLARAREEAGALQEELERARGRREALQEELAGLRDQIAAVPFSAEEYARVHTDLQRARDLAEARTRLDGLRAELATARQRLAEASAEAEAARQRFAGVQREAEAAEQVWQQAQEGLADAEKRLAALQQLARQWREATGAVEEARREADRRQREEEEARHLAEEARRQADAMEEAARDAQQRLLSLRREHAAQELRRHLHAGEPCPVCGQSVTTVPPPTDVAPALARAEAEAEACQARWQEAQEALRRASARLEGAASALEMARARLRQEVERRDALLAALRDEWGSEATPEEALRRASQDVHAQRERLQDAQAALTAARQALDEARGGLQAAERAEAAARSRAESLQHQAEELQSRVAALAATLGEDASPQALERRLAELEADRRRLEDLRQRERDLDADLRQWQQRESQARERLAAVDAEARLAESEAQEARREAETLAPALESLLREEGWEEVADALAAGGDVSPALQGLQAELNEQMQAVGQRLGALEAETKRLERDLELAARLRDEAEAAQRQARLARSLGDLLRSDRFQSFLRQEALALLAEDGSRHLRELSRGRYALVVERDEFLVRDHWNGDEERPANTLSGGETFLASLSLALALAEGLPGLAHSTRRTALESLFVDEGFSHLDDETLDVVASALEVLGGAGQRMVGVITHVPALAERMPARLRVEKSPDGSSVVKD